MIAPSPYLEIPTDENRDLAYLLLGDLRQVIEEPVGPQTSRWLLAILDMILVGRPFIRPSVFLPVESGIETCRSRSLESKSLIEKLRRLRDRIAHGGGHSALANEIREELREVMSDRMSSAACLYDA